MSFPEELKLKIDLFNVTIPSTSMVIDWGFRRGKGKRLGSGMITGAIEAPRGKVEYQSVDLSEFITEETKDSIAISLDAQPLAARYYKARKFGLDHRDGMRYALLIGHLFR